jgi:hypothetical protein
MEKIIKFLFIIFVLLVVFTTKLKGFIEIENQIKPDTINSITINRGILRLDKKYTLLSNSFLIYQDSFPNWIKIIIIRF